VNVFIAAYYAEPGSDDGNQVIGPFSTEEKARFECQEDEEEQADMLGHYRARPLVWTDDEAPSMRGGKYAVIMAEMDRRIGL
jgi:hypothetical protein